MKGREANALDQVGEAADDTEDAFTPGEIRDAQPFQKSAEFSGDGEIDARNADVDIDDQIDGRVDDPFVDYKRKTAEAFDEFTNTVGYKMLQGEKSGEIAKQLTEAQKALNPNAKSISAKQVTEEYKKFISGFADLAVTKHRENLEAKQIPLLREWIKNGAIKADVVSGKGAESSAKKQNLDTFVGLMQERNDPILNLLDEKADVNLKKGIEIEQLPEEAMSGIKLGLEKKALSQVTRRINQKDVPIVKISEFNTAKAKAWDKAVEATMKAIGETDRTAFERDFHEMQRKMSKLGPLLQQEPDIVERAVNQASYKINAATWEQIIDHVKRNTEDGNWLVAALDAGDNLFWSNPVVRRFRSLFDHRVFGSYEYEAQMVAEARYDAFENAIFDMREQIRPIISIVGSTKMLDETAEMKRILKQFPDKDKVAARTEARDILNKRNSAVIKFMEKGDALDAKLFKDDETAKQLEVSLEAVKQLFGERLDAETMAGLQGSGLHDLFVEYAPRSLYKKGKVLSKSERGKVLYDAGQESQRMRRIYLRDIPGGRSVLDEMSIDPKLSGVVHEQPIVGGKIDADLLDEKVEYMIEKYGRLEEGDGLLHKEMYDDKRNLTKDAQRKMRGLASSMMHLPLEHVEKQMPMYGRNFIHDFARYLEQSYVKESVAMAAGDMVASNLRTGETATLISKLFGEIKLDNHQAYMNAIIKSGKEPAYKIFREKKLAEMLEDAGKKGGVSFGEGNKLVQRNGDYFVITKEQAGKLGETDEMIESARKVSEDEIEKFTNFGKTFADQEQMAVTKDAYDSATFYLKPWSRPPEIGAVREMAQRSLNMFKTFVTVPFPAFHGRNFLSGQFQNFFYGLYDPSANGPNRYIRPIQQAFTIRSGKTVKDISKQVPKHVLEDARAAAPGMADDEAVTQYMRNNVFKYGITGDKQGIAAEQVGDSVSSYASQLPGSQVPDKPGLRNLFGILRAPDPEATLLDKLNPLQTRGAATPRIDKSGARPAIALETSENTNFAPARAGEDLAQATEDINRIAPFIALIKQGFSPQEAARRVQKVQIDYSTLSEFEKRIKEFVPFYTFSSRILPLTFGDLITNPGGKQRRAIDLTARGQGPTEPTPEYMKRGPAIPLGQQEDGTRRYLSGLGLAFEDPLEMAGVLTGDVGSTASALLSRVRPEIQAIGELATGRSFFNERPLEDLDPPIGRFISNITGGERDGNAQPFLSSGVEFLAAKLPTSRLVSTLNSMTDERKGVATRMLNTLTGIKITDVSPASQAYTAANLALEKLKEFGAREGGYTYIPDWQKARMTPEELAEAEGIMSWMNDIKKEASRRAKEAETLADSLANAESE